MRLQLQRQLYHNFVLSYDDSIKSANSDSTIEWTKLEIENNIDTSLQELIDTGIFTNI